MATSIITLKRSGSLFLLTAFVVFLGLATRAHTAIIQWDGGGANTNWSTANNWGTNVAPVSATTNDFEFGTLALVPPSNITANNTTNDFDVNSITFNGTAGTSFSLTGSRIDLVADGATAPSITQNSNFAQTISLDMEFSGTSLTLGGNGTGLVTISGMLDGANTLTKTGTSTYFISGNNAGLNATTTINGGTIIVGHVNSLDNNMAITVNSTGTLAINTGLTYSRPATFNSGSTLAGKGTYSPGTLTIGSGVTVAPGIADIGTLAIGNATTFAAGSTFAVSVGAGANNNDRLNVTGTLNTGAANTLALSISGANQGRYTLASATSLSIGSNLAANGGFGSVTGMDSAYYLGTTATAIELIRKATMAIDGSATATTIITGGSTSISGHVANTAIVNSGDLTYVLTGSVGVTSLPGGTLTRAAGDANAAGGALYSGSFTSATLGLNNVQVFAAGTNAGTVTNSPQSVSFNVNVIDHASGLLNGSSTNIGTVIVGASISDATFNLENASGSRAGLRLTGVTSSNSTLTGPTLIAALAAGGSQGYSASINTGTVGALAASHVFDIEDEALPGAINLPSLTYNITGNVLDHASGSLVANSTNIGNVIVGASLADTTFDLVNAGGFRAGLRLTGVTSSGSTLTGPTSIAALAAGGNINYSASIDTSTVGVLAASHVFDIEDEVLPGATDLLSLTHNISGNVLDHASGSLVGSSTNFGNVIVNALLADATFDLVNAGGFRAGLQLTGVSSTNSTLTGPTSIPSLAAGGNQAYSASIDTSTVGAVSASHVFDIEDEALSGATDLSGLTYSIAGNVLAHSNASFSSSSDDNALLINFGTVALGAGGGSLNSFFDVFALVDIASYTAGLDLDLLDSLGNIATLAVSGPGTFTLAAGGNQSYSVAFDTNTPGPYSATYTFKLSDENLAGATAPESEWLTLTLSGTVLPAVPEPTTMGLMLIAGSLILSRRRTRMA